MWHKVEVKLRWAKLINRSGEDKNREDRGRGYELHIMHETLKKEKKKERLLCRFSMTS